jgi:hypothetical protein
VAASAELFTVTKPVTDPAVTTTAVARLAMVFMTFS